MNTLYKNSLIKTQKPLKGKKNIHTRGITNIIPLQKLFNSVEKKKKIVKIRRDSCSIIYGLILLCTA